MVVLFCCVAFVLRSFFCDWRAIGAGVCTTLLAGGMVQCSGQHAVSAAGWCVGQLALDLLGFWVLEFCVGALSVFVASGYLEKQKTTKVAAYSIDSCGVRNLIKNVRHCGLLII